MSELTEEVLRVSVSHALLTCTLLHGPPPPVLLSQTHNTQHTRTSVCCRGAHVHFLFLRPQSFLLVLLLPHQRLSNPLYMNDHIYGMTQFGRELKRKENIIGQIVTKVCVRVCVCVCVPACFHPLVG